MNRNDRDEHEHHDGHHAKETPQETPLGSPDFGTRWKDAHHPLHFGQNPRTCVGNVDSPALPEKIELVSDGTRSTPTVNVTRIMTAWTPYKSWSSNPSPGGSVWMYWLRNFSK